MTVIASIEDKRAYATLRGAMDNLADSYTYVAKTISVADGNRMNPLADTGRVSKYLKVTSYAQKAYSYASKINDLRDEKKHDGAMLKLGIKISIDIAGKLLGTSLTTHPYYAYHKAMIDALADALNASRNSKAAIEAYRKAITSADSQKIADEFKRIESKKVDVVVKHFEFRDTIGIAADIARGMGSEEYLRKQIAQYGSDKLARAIADLEEWRAMWAGLSFDVMQLQLMTVTEMNAASEAMKEVKDLIDTMMKGSNTNRVVGYGTYNNIEWEKYDLIVGQGRPDQLAIDPVAFARGNCDKAAAWAGAFAEMCDFVRTEDVLFPSRFNLQLDKLGKVLYG